MGFLSRAPEEGYLTVAQRMARSLVIALFLPYIILNFYIETRKRGEHTNYSKLSVSSVRGILRIARVIYI